jgi:uncharacterized protein DUF3300
MLISGEIKADTPPPPPVAESASLTSDQLDDLVAPIALYPDTLLSQVMVASTYPLEVVQAYQWLQQHPDLKGEALTSAAQQQSWDPSVQALVAFPDVLKRLNEDVGWTTRLGNAFLANQNNVMDAVQRMRLKADQSGKLQSTAQQKVTKATEGGQTVVEIEPTNPQVIYVPVYDPDWVWGPPLYYPYPSWYWYAGYPGPGFWFGTGIFLGTFFVGCCGWGGWGWRFGWYRREVIVNNYFFNRYNFRVHDGDFHGEGPWRHDGFHRLGVAYPDRALATRFRAPVRERPTVDVVRQSFRESAVRVRSAPSEHFGGREISPGVYNHNRSAFAGVEHGTMAREYSNRGYSSLGRARTFGGSAPSGRSGGGQGRGGHSGGGSGGQGGSSGGHGGGWGGQGGGWGGQGGGWGGGRH